MNLLNNRLYAVVLLCLLAIGGAAGFSQSYRIKSFTTRPEVKIVLSGMVKRAGKNLSIEDAGQVNSGEVLNWTVVSENVGTADALSNDATAQIPAGTTFVAGSAASEVPAQVTYSIDGGKNFSPQPVTSVRQADGSVKQVPAPVSMYTQIRYHWDTPLTPSDKRAASYQVRVK